VHTTAVQTTGVHTTAVQTTDIFFDDTTGDIISTGWDATTGSVVGAGALQSAQKALQATDAASKSTLSIGAIVGIVAAVVVVAAAIAMFAGRKVHQEFMAKRNGPLSGVAENPLFVGSGSEMFNALYDPHAGDASKALPATDDATSPELSSAQPSGNNGNSSLRRQQSVIKSPSSLDD